MAEFSCDSSKRDGHEYKCKVCKSVDKMKRLGTYDANMEREALYEQGKKRCTRCGEVLPTSAFDTRKGVRGYALLSWCRGCLREYCKLRMREYDKRPEVKVAKAARERVYNRTLARRIACRERGRERGQRPEVKAQNKAYMAEYKLRPGKRELMNAASHRWVQAHPEAARETWSRYYKTPKGRLAYKVNQSARRARLAKVAVTLTRKQWTAILAAFDGRCVYCGGTVRITMDHLVPICRGGEHTVNNVVPACFSCNSRKNKVELTTFLSRLGITERAFKARLRRAGWPLAF